MLYWQREIQKLSLKQESPMLLLFDGLLRLQVWMYKFSPTAYEHLPCTLAFPCWVPSIGLSSAVGCVIWCSVTDGAGHFVLYVEAKELLG